jgi:hypothetical protein
MAIVWEHRTDTFETREIARCRTCKAAASRLNTITVKRSYRSDRCGEVSRRRTAELLDGLKCCGRSWDFKPVRGTRNDDVKCDSRCTGAVGHVCECACGGKNHGAAHSS